MHCIGSGTGLFPTNRYRSESIDHVHQSLIETRIDSVLPFNVCICESFSPFLPKQSRWHVVSPILISKKDANLSFWWINKKAHRFDLLSNPPVAIGLKSLVVLVRFLPGRRGASRPFFWCSRCAVFPGEKNRSKSSKNITRSRWRSGLENFDSFQILRINCWATDFVAILPFAMAQSATKKLHVKKKKTNQGPEVVNGPIWSYQLQHVATSWRNESIPMHI